MENIKISDLSSELQSLHKLFTQMAEKEQQTAAKQTNEKMSVEEKIELYDFMNVTLDYIQLLDANSIYFSDRVYDEKGKIVKHEEPITALQRAKVLAEQLKITLNEQLYDAL